MQEEDLTHIIKWAEGKDRTIKFYDDFEVAWQEMIEMLKELKKEFTLFWQQAESEICQGQMMRVKHLSRLRELIGIEIGPEVKK